MRSSSPDLEHLFALLAHLQECLLHLKLSTELIILDSDDTEEHEDVVGASQERQHTELGAHGHRDRHASGELVVSSWRGCPPRLLDSSVAKSLLVFFSERVLGETKGHLELPPQLHGLVHKSLKVPAVLHLGGDVWLRRPELLLRGVPQGCHPLLLLAKDVAMLGLDLRLLTIEVKLVDVLDHGLVDIRRELRPCAPLMFLALELHTEGGNVVN